MFVHETPDEGRHDAHGGGKRQGDVYLGPGPAKLFFQRDDERTEGELGRPDGYAEGEEGGGRNWPATIDPGWLLVLRGGLARTSFFI